MGYDEKMYEEATENVLNVTLQFMESHRITCSDQIYQTDSIIVDAYEFIDNLFKASKPLLNLNENGDD